MTLNLKRNLAFKVTSELDTNSNHNRILPVHLSEHLNLTRALGPGPEPTLSLSTSPMLYRTLKFSFTHALTSEPDLNCNRKPFLTVQIIEHLNLTLPLVPEVTPHCYH